MDLNDYILISRNEKVYKAKFSNLSSIVCFKSNEQAISSFLEQISAAADLMKDSYSDTHYTKTETKSDFCTTDEIMNLSANSTYVLSSSAKNILNNLNTKTDVNDWQSNQITACANLFISELNKMNDTMRSDSGSHSPNEYFVSPRVKDLVDGTGTYKI